ncbi:MAG: hypothetical protein KAX20_07585, partial [Candidatus Omnitrophica bacterium]|nr:hypothetical protein [Candidatus Omnitrophota bacterium]
MSNQERRIKMLKPTPEKIQKDIQNFQSYMQKKYGDQLGVGIFPATDAAVLGGEEEKKKGEPKEIKFDMKPEELESY